MKEINRKCLKDLNIFLMKNYWLKIIMERNGLIGVLLSGQRKRGTLGIELRVNIILDNRVNRIFHFQISAYFLNILSIIQH